MFRKPEEKSRSRTLGRRSLASATRDLCNVLVEEWEDAPPGELPPTSKARTSRFSVFREGLSAEEQVGHLTQLAIPSLQKELRALDTSEERLGTLTDEDLQEMLFDKLYPPLCALQRIEDESEKRREDRFTVPTCRSRAARMPEALQRKEAE